MSTDFSVRVDTFEGPLGVLLDLIEKHKLSINEVSLSKITDEYIEYIQKFDNYSFDQVSSFIVVAATLMLIKSRTLLPTLSVTEEEKTEIEVLEKRLEVFQVVKAIADYIKKDFGKRLLYKRPFVRIKRKVFAPGASLTRELLLQEVVSAIDNIPKEVVLPQTKVKTAIRIEEVLERLMTRVQTEARFSFKEFAKKGITTNNMKEVKTFIVVSFLAVLELVKNGTLDVSQDGMYSDITITQ
jgi:segregation and condensation protein A